MTLLEGVRTFIKTCPYLSDSSKDVNVNYLSENIDSYSIEEVESIPIIKKYIDGSAIKQYVFDLTSRESYGDNVAINLKVSEFYEKFASWLEEQSSLKKLPYIGDTKEARKFEVISSNYIADKNADKAQYKIRIRLIYLENGGM
ncbi:hypothetical protein SAMN02745163_01562 [Clostridium cavendishii DSM 21758]|uniref:Chloramphenicol resistance protein n=1 Tax=Clostridium cavendishii DSM 21758 TaxID=1121302 RepID=A0A1M6HSA5_9CLOT|nr:hypothetical protein [Clostridium cavendishii]SHJ25055.1 hypothetical protein SAMN02745163_01562 [Clostridium cavendishii DSM 21758]